VGIEARVDFALPRMLSHIAGLRNYIVVHMYDRIRSSASPADKSRAETRQSAST